jgi:hypothetical protein
MAVKLRPHSRRTVIRRRPVLLIALAGAGAALLAAASKKLGGWGEQAAVASNGAEFQPAMPDIAEGVEPDGTITTPAGNGAATGSAA